MSSFYLSYDTSTEFHLSSFLHLGDTGDHFDPPLVSTVTETGKSSVLCLTDHIAKAFTNRKAISKGADCSCITVTVLAIII